MARERVTDIDLLDRVLLAERTNPNSLTQTEHRVFSRWRRQIHEGLWVGDLTFQEREKLEQVAMRLSGPKR